MGIKEHGKGPGTLLLSLKEKDSREHGGWV